jgi:hypothetical protein
MTQPKEEKRVPSAASPDKLVNTGATVAPELREAELDEVSGGFQPQPTPYLKIITKE